MRAPISNPVNSTVPIACDTLPKAAVLDPKRVLAISMLDIDRAGATYFSTPLLLGKNGLEKILSLPKVNANEKELLKKAIQELKKNIQKGEELVKKK
ncbi:probable malate dehydrogenase, mitochondrial [Culex quinquefasciatus]|uniref:probable malate dehydrogenase, mitochondrial n=1 Tax=Culex quinquefasciatus TaxID=7176 RepID=UPI0018E29EBE|nr:probable malate dehydrogenase, mitochondrial [Culex quinquefasciatus]